MFPKKIVTSICVDDIVTISLTVPMMHKRQFSDFVTPVKSAQPCSHCGCTCNGRFLSDPRCTLDLQQRIEELQSQLLKSQAQMSNLEIDCQNRIQAGSYEMLKLRDELVKLRDRYERLLEGHKRMQKINDSLENKILIVVNEKESEKTLLQKEVASMTSKLIDAKSLICDLEDENERYRDDCNLAVQLLQCKPSNFVGQKLTALPLPLQERVKNQMTGEQMMNLDNDTAPQTKLIHVPMQTFPPTAMVYSVPKHSNDISNDAGLDQNVPTSLIAKVLAHPESKRKPVRRFFCAKCREDLLFANKETQTQPCVQKERENGSKGPVGVHRIVRNQSSTSSTEADI